MMSESTKTYIKKHWLWLSVNVGILLAVARLLMLVWAAPDSSSLAFYEAVKSREPVLFSGMVALILLVLSLACTPAASIFGFRRAITVRKSLGLWSFGFVLFHVLFLIGNKGIFYDPGAWATIWMIAKEPLSLNVWGKMPYARAGVIAFLLLVPLALTSNRFAMRTLGKNWKRLHRLVYLAVPVAVWHYWWREGFVAEWGGPSTPAGYTPSALRFLFAALVALLLIVRLSPVRQRIKRLSWRP